MEGNPLLFSRPLMFSLLFGYISVCALHLTQLPVWMWFFCSVVIVWRIQVLREKLASPNRIIKLLFTSMLCVFLFFQYDQWIAVEPTVSLLLVALTLKLLEIRHRRDVLVILFLYYFLVACGFLFEQSVVYSVASVVVVVLITSVLIQLHSWQAGSPHLLGQQSARQYTKQALINSVMLSGKLLFQSAFLAAVMLLLLPRLNPLWEVPIHSEASTTGMSDSMSPGDISSLIQNNSLAFRVTFNGDTVSKESMYWRGLVFDDFDGRRWQRSELVSQSAQVQRSAVPKSSNAEASSTTHNITQYEVLLEATGQNWLYAIPQAIIAQGIEAPVYSPQGEIFQSKTIGQRIKYQVRSHQQRDNINTLSDADYRRLTYIPPNSNSRSQRTAREWWQQSPSHEAYVQKVLSYYREKFTYTLSPPKLGKDTVDEFLFDTRQGFCEHFSSSFTVLMRAAGIPARVVVGYQGGEWSKGGEYLQVYQRDAHAWAEVWLQNKGWVRVDPTAAVAAIRIQEGVSAALPQRERIFVGNSAIYNYRWLKDLQQQWSTMDYRWQRWVLDYDNDKQQSILEKYLGEITMAKIIIAVVFPLTLAAAIIGFGLFRGSLLRKYLQQTPEKKLYLLLQKKLLKLGVKYDENESLKRTCERAVNEFPGHKDILYNIYGDLEELFYRPEISKGQIVKICARIRKNIHTLK
jgi:transglutaminase-like putative cysteine protease